MPELEQYLRAATRASTRRSYQAAIEHFEVQWGGLLPASSESIARYLVDHAEKLALNTLKLRLTALGQWHRQQGFPDPTSTPLVRQTLKGIRVLHPAREKQAAPLQLAQLEQVDAWLGTQIAQAEAVGRSSLRWRRDRCLLLLGFWRGFRSDELCRLQIEDLQFHADHLDLYLPFSKGDRAHLGQHYQVPALRRLCPVAACRDWLQESALESGPLLRRVDRWGRAGQQGLHVNSVIPLLRRLLQDAGIDADGFSSHSLRRGFASWAVGSGWDIKALMQYVGWKDMRSALRYIDSQAGFDALRLLPGER